jgi:hypothetical protein
MRLYLSSYRIPNFQIIKDFFGGDLVGLKVLIITNAKDHREKINALQRIEDLKQYLSELGFIASTVDLRDYSTKPDILRKLLSNSDLLYAIGGNQFSLSLVFENEAIRDVFIDVLKGGKVYIGGSTAEIEESPKVTQYSLSKIGDCLKEVNLLSEAVENIYKNKYGLKRISKKHKETAWFITESIIMNVPRGSWDENIEQYFENGNKETLQADEIYDLAATHEIDICTASLLFHSKLQDSQDNK